MLLDKIRDRSAIVGILGLGYVGLPLASAFVKAGFPVLGFDTDASKIEDLDAGRNYLRHLGDDMTQTMKASDHFEATTDFDRLESRRPPRVGRLEWARGSSWRQRTPRPPERVTRIC